MIAIVRELTYKFHPAIHISTYILVLCAFFAMPVQAFAKELTGNQRQVLDGLVESDARLNNIFWKLSTANSAYCDPRIRATGLVLHARSSYQGEWREAASVYFGFEGEVGIEAVDSDSPAARSDIQAKDTLIAVNGIPLGSETGPNAVAAAYNRLADAGSGGSVSVTVLRNGQRHNVTIGTVAACTQRVELQLSSAKNAQTDGTIIQINSAYMNMGLTDAMLASVIAHELGHFVLHHPDRLAAAGAYRGLAGIFGGNRRLIRKTEIAADEISVYLMYNAGYDPEAAIAFWKLRGGPILTDPSHPSTGLRKRLIAAEIEKLKMMGPAPVRPPQIDHRDDPLR